MASADHTPQTVTSHQIEEIRDIATCAICLDLFENARLLSCSHSFCYNCLLALTEDRPGSYSRCPQCRELSIPAQGAFSDLTVHTFINQLANLVREQDGDCIADVEDEESTCDGELFVGELLPVGLQEQQNKRSKNAKLAINVLKGVATIATLGIGGLYLSRQAAKKRRRREEQIAQDPNESFNCDACLKNQKYSECELRYKCGMCEDFSLCRDCAVNPSTQIHRPDHIFIKLKFKQRRQLPTGCLLKYKKARDMSEELDFNSNIHGKNYYHSPESLEWKDSIQCKFCGESPICGTRYKCGMCKDYDLCESCEEHSQDIHEKDHVFLVFKYHSKINVISEPLIKAMVY